MNPRRLLLFRKRDDLVEVPVEYPEHVWEVEGTGSIHTRLRKPDGSSVRFTLLESGGFTVEGCTGVFDNFEFAPIK